MEEGRRKEMKPFLLHTETHTCMHIHATGKRGSLERLLCAAVDRLAEPGRRRRRRRADGIGLQPQQLLLLPVEVSGLQGSRGGSGLGRRVEAEASCLLLLLCPELVIVHVPAVCSPGAIALREERRRRTRGGS
jgi:hypothetical protein